MANYITKIRTTEGDKSIDYNALANVPKWKYLGTISYSSEKDGNATLSQDSEGNSFECDEIYIRVTAQSGGVSYRQILVNGRCVGELRNNHQYINIYIYRAGDYWTCHYISSGGTYDSYNFGAWGLFHPAYTFKAETPNDKIRSVGLGYVTSLECEVYGR